MGDAGTFIVFNFQYYSLIRFFFLTAFYNFLIGLFKVIFHLTHFSLITDTKETDGQPSRAATLKRKTVLNPLLLFFTGGFIPCNA